MNLHEFQAKELLKKYRVEVQDGVVVERASDAINAYNEIRSRGKNNIVVIKAQIHAGGRGKGLIKGTDTRGVCIVKSAEEAKAVCETLLGGVLVTKQTGEQGKEVRKVLFTGDIYYDGPEKPQEFYLSILLDRGTSQNVIIYSTEGGMDIEEVAEKSPEKIHKEFVLPGLPLEAYQARKIAFNLGLQGNAFKQMVRFVTNLYKAYVDLDCAMVEINPLFKTSDEQIVAVDCKMNLEDNALIRHSDFAILRDLTEEDSVELEARNHGLNFIKLSGNVGCMVNGAGLAMATMDMIKLSGGDPANFLDVGGVANAETVAAGFRLILQDPKVKVILVNIFGGIVRCDRVAQGVIDAYHALGSVDIPIVVRLQGTNAEEAKAIIDKSGLKVRSATLLSDAAKLVQEILQA